MRSLGLVVFLILASALVVGCPQAPKITVQPQSQTVNPGETARFTVEALRADDFDWLKDGVVIEAASEPVLLLPAVSENDEGTYQARAKNGAGYADSSVAYLTVNDSPVITDDPDSIEVNPGNEVVLSITATGTDPLSYEWYRNGQSVGVIGGPELVIESAKLADIGGYYCVVSNVTGQDATSAEAMVTLTGYPAQGIAFTSVPEYGSFDNLYGVAFGVNPAEYRVVVYNESTWGYWVKPYVGSPITWIASGYIGNDYNWVCDVTTGSNDEFALGYVAFLLPNDVDPVLCTGNNGGWGGVPCPTQPEIPGAVGSPAVVHRLEVRTIEAFGMIWEIKFSDFPVDPGQHPFSDREEDVFVDESGHIHMISRYYDGKWYSVEIVSQESFGYGTYIFQVQGLAGVLDINRVLGLFVYELLSSHPAHREIDALEIAMWGDLLNLTNAQFVVQPCTACPGCANCTRFSLDETSDFTTYLVWAPGHVEMRTYQGNHLEGVPPFTNLVAQWSFDGPDVPEPANEKVRMNLWILAGMDPANGLEEEVVITGFTHQLEAPWIGGVEPTVSVGSSATEVVVGSSVTFTATAAGSEPISYLWKKDGAELVGQTTQTLEISQAQLGDAGDYTCVVTNPFGTSESVPIHLSVVLPDPEITKNPESQTVNPGSTAVFEVIASGGVAPLEYQWYKKVGAADEPISGATSSILTLANVGQADETGYWCRVANATGPIKIVKLQS